MNNVVPFPSTPHIKSGQQATPYVARAAEFIYNVWKDSKSPPVLLPGRAVMRHSQNINPYTFVIITDEFDCIRGVVEIYSIKRAPLLKLLSGKISEADLEDKDFLPYKQRSKWNLYVAITSPLNPDYTPRVNDHFTLACIIGSICNIRDAYLKPVIPTITTDVTLYGFDASTEGRKLMTKHLDFKVHSPLTKIRHQIKTEEESVWHRKLTNPDVEGILTKYQRQIRLFSL